MKTKRLRETAPSRIVALLKRVPSFEANVCEQTMREVFFSCNDLFVMYGKQIYNVTNKPFIYNTYSY